MSEENKKIVRVKLVRHEWPDERAARKKRQRNILLGILACLLCFSGGFVVASIQSPKQTSSVSNSKYNTIYRIMSEKWYFGKDNENLVEDLQNGAINGMVNSGGDIHTSYLDPESAESFVSSMEGNFVGIGVQYSTLFEDDNIVINVFQGSPAHEAGMQVGDIIRKIDGVDTSEFEELKDGIIGEAGTNVEVTVERNGELIPLVITRNKFDSSVNGEIKGDVGILTLNSFAESSADTVGMYLNYFKVHNIDKLIIDLRGNGGGYLTTVQDIASYLLPEGSLVLQERVRDDSLKEFKTNSSIKQISFEDIVVLVDGSTASAAEVLTADVKELLDATVIGKNTYGKGTVQTSIPFSDGSIIKYTIAEWLSPLGNTINGTGIKPDIEVDIPDALLMNFIWKFEENYEVDSVSEICMTTQIWLDFLGYEVDRMDGYFSEKTLEALRQFKLDNGLEEDVIDQETADLMSHLVYRKWVMEKDTLDEQMRTALEVIHGE